MVAYCVGLMWWCLFVIFVFDADCCVFCVCFEVGFVLLYVVGLLLICLVWVDGGWVGCGFVFSGYYLILLLVGLFAVAISTVRFGGIYCCFGCLWFCVCL